MTFIKRHLKAIIASSVLLLPVASLAALGDVGGNLGGSQSTGFSNIQSSVATLTGVINQLIPFIISIGLLVFLIGVVQYVSAGGDEEKRTAARGMIIFGIIALFVMVSVWGFVNILTKTFFSGQATQGPVTIPLGVQPPIAR